MGAKKEVKTKTTKAEVVNTTKPTVVKTEGNEVVVKPPNPLVASAPKARGAAEGMSSQDVAMPTVILMQAKSTFVEDEKKKIVSGDFVHSSTELVLGGKGKPLKFVSCFMFKTVQIWHGDENNSVYIETKAWTPAMVNDEYQSVVKVDGKDVLETRKLVYNHCGYLPDHARKIGDRMAASPVIVKFKGLSKKHCRKQLNSMITDLSMFNEASWQYEFELSTMAEETEKFGKHNVWQIKLGNKVSAELDTWGEILYHKFAELQNAGKLKASDNDENTEGAANGQQETNINEKEIPKDAKKVAF